MNHLKTLFFGIGISLACTKRGAPTTWEPFVLRKKAKTQLRSGQLESTSELRLPYQSEIPIVQDSVVSNECFAGDTMFLDEFLAIVNNEN